MGILRTFSRRAARLGGLGAALAVVTSACFLGDPATSSLIINDTGAPIEVELVLDRTQWRFGFEPDEYEVWLSERTDEWIRDELEEYASQSGPENELIAVDTDRWAGTYVIEPAGTLVVDASLGDGPNVRFSELTVTTANGTTTLVGQDQILDRFEEINKGEFEFRIGDSD